MESSESSESSMQQQQTLNSNQVNINMIENGSNNLNIAHNDQPKLTPEQEQEMQLKLKYPNPQKPGGSAFIQKMLHRGSKKYFDSGDYNMAKSKNKIVLNNLNINNSNLNNNINSNSNSNNIINNINNSNCNLNNSNDINLTNDSTNTNDSTTEFNSPNTNIMDSQTVTPNAVANVSSLNGVNETILTTNLSSSPNLNNLNVSNINQQNSSQVPLAGLFCFSLLILFFFHLFYSFLSYSKSYDVKFKIIYITFNKSKLYQYST
jgi:hypothetical protein